MTQAWIGEAVIGAGQIEDSIMTQIFNASTQFELRVDSKSAYIGLVGCAVDPQADCLIKGDQAIQAEHIPSVVLKRSASTNYMKDPTSWAGADDPLTGSGRDELRSELNQ